MKKAVVTIAGGDYFQRMASLTHPTIRAYADRIGADFIVWSDLSGYAIPEYKKMEIGRLLESYDRVLHIDTDVLVRGDAPDIFNVVPVDRLGVLDEGRYFDRRDAMQRFMVLLGRELSAWEGGYYNAGVFVCSRCHREMFVRPPVEHDSFRDQSWFNLMICDHQVSVFELPHRFNRLAALDSVYGEDRLDSWFLHYAGVRSMVGGERLLELIKHDWAAWQRLGVDHRFRQNIAIVVEGGLGDHVAAEPVLRFAREVVYPNDNLVAVSGWGELYSHLNLPVFDRLEAIPNYRHYRLRYTVEDPHARNFVARHEMHPTTLAAFVALGRELPFDERRPRLSVNPAALESIRQKVSHVGLEQLVLLHPGRGVPANTFPPDVWQSYADALVDCRYSVAVVGGQSALGQGVVEFDRSRCIDLVDRLNLQELVALVSQARALVSNDAAPVQIAGAFDNWIGLIATLRDPRHVLPCRNHPQSWRAASLEREEMCRDFLHRPSGGEQPPLDVCNERRLRCCLPEPEAVAAFVNAAFAEA